MKNFVLITFGIAASAMVAGAADFTATYTGSQGGGSVQIGGVGSYGGGHMQFINAVGNNGAGQFSNASFSTFCIDLFPVNGSNANDDWTIQSIASAPVDNDTNPNGAGPYGAAREAAVHDVVWKAIDLGWIKSDLSATDLYTNADYGLTLMAIQGAIWYALFQDGDTPVTSTNATIQARMNTLTSTIGDNNTVAGLRAMTNDGNQDMLYVVPLPPAAFAGLATLVGVAGVARLRRR